MRRGTNLPAVGGFNQTVILDLIRRSGGGLSRVEIAEQTGLSAPTISNVCRRLLEDGLIVETGKRIQGPGKPRVILELDPKSRFALGVHLDPAVVTYAVLDLHGDVVSHMRRRTPSSGRPAKTVTAMASAIDEVVARSGVDRERLLGLGIAAPGPIDAARGIVVDPPLLEGWQNVPLRDALADATGLPVLLEKDVTAAVVAELWRNSEREDFAFFYLGTGIGVGLALGGEVLRGATGNAGEGGTLVVSGDLPPKRRSDMLGHVATPPLLVAQAIDAGVLADRADPVDEMFAELVAAAEAGDTAATAILDRAARLIASSIVSIVNLLDVAEVVFGGPYWDRVADRFLATIGELVNSSAHRVTRHPVTVSTSSIGADVAAAGAACLVLDTSLSPRTSSLLIST
ncbi:ROK family transcriptional regulator [Actinophytocola oryzae]|uniref:Putative NBD/HSP70 family sugar kinase n=1 Tax=Actinophytocola oryzae TaxID=502181 RepID=A0A4R7W550_9PSEU|nr:ROK family transcriptional regulator [Actinophytocola oryzae]TDV57863.1 putative NBD/HSP70 family sugar kinase [Actinophytocola oryzae]